MHSVLVGIQDPVLCDKVRTAFRYFRGIRAHSVPRDRLLDVLAHAPPDCVAVVVDHEPGHDGVDDFIARLREVDRDIRILAVAGRVERQHFTRAKVELDVFSFIPLPLDPFDLLRRIHRLMQSLGQPAPA